MNRAILLLLGAIALISAAEASEGRTFFGLTFPETIEGARSGAFNDYETTDPGYGYSVQYSRPGWNMTVYIYDLGLSVIPSNVESGPILDAFEQAKKEIALRFNGVDPRREFTASKDGGPKFLCASYTVQTSAVLESLLCVTSRKDKFVKFRVTGKRTETSDIEAQEFVAAWSKVLWP